MGEGVPSIAGLGELREVGRGGFGVVYDGFQFEFGRRVAVKVLNRRLVDDGSVASFELECRSMGVLSKHPYIVTVLASAFTSDHRPCIVMELFEHGNYLTKIARDGPLSVQELLSLGVCMAGAVETAHRQGVVHGDVKPQNIFLSEFGYPALGDFGVAALQGLWSGGGLSLSVDYAAPELIGEDTTVLGPLSDQYSLGATLYTLATGRRPFETVSHESPHQTLMRMRSEPGPRLPDSFPEPLVTAVGTAMAHNPQHRYPDLATFAASLSHIERQLGYPPTKIPLPATSQNTPTGLTTPTTPDPTTPESPTIIRPTRSATPTGQTTPESPTIIRPTRSATPTGQTTPESPTIIRPTRSATPTGQTTPESPTIIRPTTEPTQQAPDAQPKQHRRKRKTITTALTVALIITAIVAIYLLNQNNTTTTTTTSALAATVEPPDTTSGTTIAAPTTTPITTVPLNAVAAGDVHSCGLLSDSTITCWGSNLYGQSDAPPGEFTAIAAGYVHSCGLLSDSTITCWGSNLYGQSDAPPGEFTAIAAGYVHSCGLLSDSTITCWGSNLYGQSDAPPGEFTAIAAGYKHSCGLLSDSTITCWGSNSDGQSDAPPGEFTAIAAGLFHSCGLLSDSTITCWGSNSDGQSDAPPGEFTAIAAGDVHSCGLLSDSTITCWGSNLYGQSDAPPGEFTAVAAGDVHSCGLRTGYTSSITCWGSIATPTPEDVVWLTYDRGGSQYASKTTDGEMPASARRLV